MTTINITLSAPLHDSFRVRQVGGMFDVPLAARLTERLSFDLPADFPNDRNDWQIGLIVGPSGSGKTTVARHLFGNALVQHQQWSNDKAVIDGFDERLSTRDVSQLLTAVGFSSPPSWIKPYGVLSNGEKFRCDLARALSRNVIAEKCGRWLVDSGQKNTDHQPQATGHVSLTVFDEFTSVVDRTVAQIGSAALAKTIRAGHIPGRFVAVTCHYDVANWLEPDWVLDMATRTLSRRRLRRPAIRVDVVRTHHRAWELFKHHHYLSGQLSKTARCYAACWNEQPVSFCAVLPAMAQRGHWRITRLVTLPDFQGIGIGMKLAEAVAAMYARERLRMSITASHPSVIAHCRKSDVWRTRRVAKTGSRPSPSWRKKSGGTGGSLTSENKHGAYCGSLGRAVVTFEYCEKTFNTKDRKLERKII